MERATTAAVNLRIRYRCLDSIALERTADEGRRIGENAALFVMLCAFWGLVLFVALTTALR